MREIAHGLMSDLVPVAVGAAQQLRLIDAALINARRRGYMDSAGSSRHCLKIATACKDVKPHRAF